MSLRAQGYRPAMVKSDGVKTAVDTAAAVAFLNALAAAVAAAVENGESVPFEVMRFFVINEDNTNAQWQGDVASVIAQGLGDGEEFEALTKAPDAMDDTDTAGGRTPSRQIDERAVVKPGLLGVQTVFYPARGKTLARPAKPLTMGFL